ncbi:unnamed protein product [Linum trigynum]|uniref:Reverse transcriptase domain-containing protein n=1 Tax=Linum trigynum TaxID=586398 RepID=A0AAV2CIF5_9ROSI
MFPDCNLAALERVESDHNPLYISWGDFAEIKRPWKFENMWLEDERLFKSAEVWFKAPVFGKGAVFLWSRRLIFLKRNIKIWNKETFGNVKVRIDNLLSGIKQLDDKEDCSNLQEVERAEREELKAELQNTLNMQELSWRQKSRESWHQKGERNTRYFHRMANYRRKVNFISRIQIDGRYFEGKQALGEAIANEYKLLFQETTFERPFPNDYLERSLDEDDCRLLTLQFTEKEIWSAIRDCDGFKAPGPDGFTFEFYKKCWPLCKKDIMLAFEEFHDNGYLPDSVTHAFICLTPKVDVVESVKDLRPICLMNRFHKILSKVLMKRMSIVLPKLISHNQHASVIGRHISEAALIANEAIDSRRKSKKSGLIFKLDIEKAFDNVSWDCLFKIIRSVGFSEKWQQ